MKLELRRRRFKRCQIFPAISVLQFQTIMLGTSWLLGSAKNMDNPTRSPNRSLLTLLTTGKPITKASNACNASREADRQRPYAALFGIVLDTACCRI